MFMDASSLEALDLSSFDTRNVTDVRNMLGGMPSLRELTLGRDFEIIVTAHLSGLRPTSEFTGRWQAVGNGTVSNPQGEVFTSAQLMSQFDGTMADTFVWQPVRD